MYIKRNKDTLKFFNPENIPIETIMSGLHDQQYINMNKNKLQYKKLPLDLFPNGAHYYANHNKLDHILFTLIMLLAVKRGSL